jgi:death-on-curing protein
VSGFAWCWVAERVVYAVHDAQIAEHGGLAGLRDQALLLSALARPQHLAAYQNPDAAALAASYAAGIARNHPFLDGNKRTALVVAAGVFLPSNGFRLTAAHGGRVQAMLAVAEGSMPEAQLAAWFRKNIRELSQ